MADIFSTADDLTFSSHSNSFPNCIVKKEDDHYALGTALVETLNKQNFEVNFNKIHIRTTEQRQEVTGLIVNRKLNIRREYLQEVRAILHNCEKDGLLETAKKYLTKRYGSAPRSSKKTIALFQRSICGRIRFIGNVKGIDNMKYLLFAKQANKIFGDPIFDVSLIEDLKDVLLKDVFIIEAKTEENIIQGSAFILEKKGVLTACHVIKKAEECNALVVELYNAENYPDNPVAKRGIAPAKICSNEKIDYCLLDLSLDSDTHFALGDSKNLSIGTSVIIAGYPDYNDGDSITIQKCEITKYKEDYLGAPLFIG